MKDKSQKGLSGFLSGISVDDCAESCLTELEFDCYSFVYCYKTGVCLLASTYAQNRTDLIYDRPKCDLYYSKTLILNKRKHIFLIEDILEMFLFK